MIDQLNCAAEGAAPPDVTWDYMVATIHTRHTGELEEQLKAHGQNGWELFFINLPMAYEYQCIFRKCIRK